MTGGAPRATGVVKKERPHAGGRSSLGSLAKPAAQKRNTSLQLPCFKSESEMQLSAGTIVLRGPVVAFELIH